MIKTDNITINTQSSIRIAGPCILYFDPFEIEDERHDADVIFITHDHYDHFQPESIAKVKKDDTLLVAPESVKDRILKESGIEPGRCRFFLPGTVHEMGKIFVETVPAYNRHKPFHPKGKHWMGYNVKMDGVSYYVAGDTDAIDENRKVRCDVAIVPIGGHFTMDAKQAAELVLEIDPQAAIPSHYGSLVGELSDGDDFAKYVIAKNRDIRVDLKIKGETEE
ncbi:MAG: MBL fold metallo-hydrolase [Butyrivibrio sp.]